jgi:hypothetical protein
LPVLPADEDYAMSVLSVFRSAGVGPRQSLDAQRVDNEYSAPGVLVKCNLPIELLLAERIVGANIRVTFELTI